MLSRRSFDSSLSVDLGYKLFNDNRRIDAKHSEGVIHNIFHVFELLGFVYD